MAAKIKKGDTVIVIAGRDKGRTGEVIEMRRDDGRALVRGVNMVKRHQKQSASQEGGIISKEAPIHLSNIALADPKDGKPTRVGFKYRRQGRRPQESARRQAFGSRDRWLIPKTNRQKSRISSGRWTRKLPPRRRRRRPGRTRPPSRTRQPARPKRPTRSRARPEPRVPARLKVQVRGGDPQQARRAVRLQEPLRSAGAGQGRHQYGHRRRRRRPQEGRRRRRRSRPDRRPEGDRHQGAQVDRHLQAARPARRSAAR